MVSGRASLLIMIDDSIFIGMSRFQAARITEAWRPLHIEISLADPDACSFSRRNSTLLLCLFYRGCFAFLRWSCATEIIGVINN
jgi:hypothetical protein